MDVKNMQILTDLMEELTKNTPCDILDMNAERMNGNSVAISVRAKKTEKIYIISIDLKTGKKPYNTSVNVTITDTEGRNCFLEFVYGGENLDMYDNEENYEFKRKVYNAIANFYLFNQAEQYEQREVFIVEIFGKVKYYKAARNDMINKYQYHFLTCKANEPILAEKQKAYKSIFEQLRIGKNVCLYVGDV